MLICHKLVSSNGAVVQQACHMSDVHATLASVYHASVARGCVQVSTSSSLIYDFWFLQHHHSAATPHHHCCCMTQLLYPWKLHACRANNNYFLYIFFCIFCSMYLVLFSIVLYRTIVAVYTDNIFLYNYLQQMHQTIIHLSPLGCFTPARGKSVQKNREVSGVKKIADKIFDTATLMCPHFC